MNFLIMVDGVLMQTVRCPSGVSVSLARNLLAKAVERQISVALFKGLPKESVSVICELSLLLA